MKHVILLLFSICTLQLLGQDHFNVAFLRSSTQLDDNKVNDFEFSLSLPLKLKNDNYFILGINNIQYDLQASNLPNTSLNINMLRLGYSIHKAKNKTTFLALPKLNTGNQKYSSQIGGLLHYQRIVNDNFSWTTGMLYNTDLFGHFFLPVLGVKWKVNDKLWLYGDLPIYMHLLYKLNDKNNLGMQFRGIISSHPFTKDYYFETSQDWICLYYEKYISKNLVIQPSAGIFFIRNLNYFERGDQLGAKVAIINLGNRNQLQDSPIKGMTPFVGIHLFYRVQKH